MVATLFFDPNNTPISAGKKLVSQKMPASDAPPRQTDEQRQLTLSWVDENSPNYKGPGYELHTDANGDYTIGLTKDPILLGRQADYERDKAAAGAGTSTDPGTPGQTVSLELPDSAKELLNTPAPPAQPRTLADTKTAVAGFTRELPSSAATYTPPSNPYARDPASGRTSAPYLPTGAGLPGGGSTSTGGGGTGGTGGPGAGAPTVDRAKIDAILNPLGSYQNAIADLAADNTGESAAEAMLKKADALARQRASDELLRSSQGAMGAARSARNRGDRALLERQAVGEQAYLGSQAQREDVLRQAELEGNLAGLRATETEHDRQFRLDALSKAAELGLNRGALEVDIGKADLQASTQMMNNTFQEMLANKQIDEAQYEALLVHNDRQMQNILSYTQAMAALQYQYDQLSVQDQQVADQMLMQKYGIDQQTLVALKKIKEDGKFQWDQVLTGIAGGVGSGLTGGLFGVLGGGKKAPTP